MSFEVEILRECSRCGAVRPLAEFTRNGRCQHGRSRMCLACDNVRKRLTEQARDPTSDEATRRLIDNAPDPAIPETIRRVLATHRASGAPFKRAWQDALAIALGDLGPRERTDWLRACAWARPAWAASYRRAPWPEPFVAVVVPSPEGLAA